MIKRHTKCRVCNHTASDHTKNLFSRKEEATLQDVNAHLGHKGCLMCRAWSGEIDLFHKFEIKDNLDYLEYMAELKVKR